MEKTISLSTTFGNGWNAFEGGTGGLADVVAGPGILIQGNEIRVAPVDPVITGTYTNPRVTVDETGRIMSIEDGLPIGGDTAVALADKDALNAYTGNADTVIVLDEGDGRSSVYVREAGAYKGPAYLTGATGKDGTNGTNGTNGLDGAQGPRGFTGERGADGPQGPQGPQGVAGARGADGAQGAEGPQGPQGVKGDTGSALVPNGYGLLDEDRVTAIRNRPGPYFFLVDDMGDLRANKLTPSGITGDMSRHVIGWNGIYFTDYGPLTGAQGVQGIQGPQGVQGERGPQGIQGPAGSQGERGLQGERGIPGTNGQQGLQGLQGLTGATGAQGPQGERGLTGAQGVAGVAGIQGPAGTTGATGPKGDRGDSASFRGVMYTVATSGGRVAASTAFQPVPVPLLVYNVGGLNFRPSGTADNALVVPSGVSFVRISAGLGFINNNVVVDSSFHFTAYKNGVLAWPGSPSLVGKFPYTNSRFSISSGVLQVEAGDVFSLIFATSTPAGQKTPTEHTFFSMEVIG